MSNDDHFQKLLARYFDEALTVDQAAELNSRLAESTEARALFWQEAQIHFRLRQWGEQCAGVTPLVSEYTPKRSETYTTKQQSHLEPSKRKWLKPFRIHVLKVAALLILTGLGVVPWIWQLVTDSTAPPRNVARFVMVNDARWVRSDENHLAGENIHQGQRLELSSGAAKIEFDSGAVVDLRGPAIFDITSENSAFLTVGRLKATAKTRSSRGFTVDTRNSRIVERGTGFSAETSVDGYSQVGVASGSVEVRLTEDDQLHLLRSGDIMAIEPGPNRVLVRIENGDATPAFRFPTISSPSKNDFIDQARLKGQPIIFKAFGALSQLSGPLDTLADGVGQSARDRPDESVFFKDNVVGMIQLDLGEIVPISRINCYSWHHNQTLEWNRIRAKQQFELYGSNERRSPSVDRDLTENGWNLIARVNTDDFFGVEMPGDRPPQQVSSITAASGLIGEYRYLLWKIIPTQVHGQSQLNSTFFGEIDVFVDEDHYYVAE